MKKTLTHCLAAVAAIFVLQTSVSAHAFFIEPYVGVGFLGDAESGSSSDKSSHTALGLRAGTGILGLAFAGLDASMMKSKVDSTGDPEFDRTTLGVVAGVDLPLVRAWVGYNFKDDWKGDSVNYDLTGKSTKLGVGLGMLPFIEINLEYLMYTADDIETASTTTSSDFKDNSVILSVSLPLP